MSQMGKEETEDLISWMEDNLEVMKGKQALWYKQVKDDLFESKDQITAVRIGQKIALSRSSRCSWIRAFSV
ncbi:hypothetical protein BGX38DRAFT_1167562 [Terfezia claveryi]|nr:hypothetical protein BGX38DRAFT_1167562 [Terfezia claveryi]